MANVIQQAIREPSTENAAHYAQRVHRLAAAYTALFVGSLIGIGLLIWQAQLYVTLAQRSNVEALTLAFFLIFFAYLAALSVSGARGALRIVAYALQVRAGADWVAVEQRKVQALGPATAPPAVVALNMVLEKEGHPHEAFELAIADRAGSMGAIVVEGAALTHRHNVKDGSNTLLAFVVQQANKILEARGARASLDVVEWHKIDDEETEEYLSMVRFACNLEKHLQADELWPKRILTTDDCAELERRLAAVCASLRNEAFLPHWEYAGQHQIPLIPEPLGLISLSRTEKRVDPLASMGCAVLIVFAVAAVLLLLILFPPWVPGV